MNTDSASQISTARLTANRANAQKSTGPRTAVGKRQSSRNAITHGFYAREVCIDERETSLFPGFVEGFHRDLNPRTPEEDQLVETIISCAWQMRRILKLETERLRDISRMEGESLGEALLKSADRYKGFFALSAHQSRLQRTTLKARKELRDLRKSQPTQGTSHHSAPLALQAVPMEPEGQHTPQLRQRETAKTNPLGGVIPDLESNPTPCIEEQSQPEEETQIAGSHPYLLTPEQSKALDRLRIYQRHLHSTKNMAEGPEKQNLRRFATDWIEKVMALENFRDIPEDLIEFDPSRDLASR